MYPIHTAEAHLASLLFVRVKVWRRFVCWAPPKRTQKHSTWWRSMTNASGEDRVPCRQIL